MQPTWTLTFKNGLKVNVPADLDNPVTLTLLEHEDWPEPEAVFLRQLSQPGMCILDADTGYGLYALSLAQALQGQGKVLALNPDPLLFACSIADNGLESVIRLDNRDAEWAFDLIRLGAGTPFDSRWLHKGDPLIVLPRNNGSLVELEAAGLGLYRLIPALNALSQLPSGFESAAQEKNGWAGAEEATVIFACSDTRAVWLRNRGRLVRPAELRDLSELGG